MLKSNNSKLRKIISGICLVLIIAIAAGLFCYLTNGFSDIKTWFPKQEIPIEEIPSVDVPATDVPKTDNTVTEPVNVDEILTFELAQCDDLYMADLTDSGVIIDLGNDVKVNFNNNDFVLKQFFYGDETNCFWSDSGTNEDYTLCLGRLTEDGVTMTMLTSLEPGTLRISKKKSAVAQTSEPIHIRED